MCWAIAGSACPVRSRHYLRIHFLLRVLWSAFDLITCSTFLFYDFIFLIFLPTKYGENQPPSLSARYRSRPANFQPVPEWQETLTAVLCNAWSCLGYSHSRTVIRKNGHLASVLQLTEHHQQTRQMPETKGLFLAMAFYWLCLGNSSPSLKSCKWAPKANCFN